MFGVTGGQQGDLADCGGAIYEAAANADSSSSRDSRGASGTRMMAAAPDPKAHSRLRHICTFCAGTPADGGAERARIRTLRLLALLEHPDALPADLALRLGAELLMLTAEEPSRFRCEPA